MALVTLRVLDGPERGKGFHQITTPVSIGREEGNFIQLNDERVSRYHLKIHENQGAIVLTDLQSTNGTRVNGEVVQVWQLRAGDIISLGRSVMVFGSTEEIASRLIELNQRDQIDSVPMGAESEAFSFLEKSVNKVGGELASHLFEIEIFRGMAPNELAPLHLLYPPKPPKGSSPKETAEMAEYLQYLLLRLRYLVSTVKKEGVDSEEQRVSLSADQWQNLLDLYGKISEHLNSVTEP
jgi:pSer/pThr/pTyr-binding forkhead associated (FHA) protein